MKRLFSCFLVLVALLTTLSACGSSDSEPSFDLESILKQLENGYSSDFSSKEKFTEGFYTYVVENEGATIIAVNASISGDITIPTFLGDYPVRSINNGAFSFCESLTSITMPPTLTDIRYSAFFNCDKLTSVHLNSGLKAIGACAFRQCDKLTSIAIPDGVIYLGEEAFYSCSSLTSVTLGTGITEIKKYTFAGCSMTSIVIPDGVTSIAESAFQYCSDMVSITLPDSVTEIHSDAFTECNNLLYVYYGGNEEGAEELIKQVDKYNFEYAVWYCNDGEKENGTSAAEILAIVLGILAVGAMIATVLLYRRSKSCPQNVKGEAV